MLDHPAITLDRERIKRKIRWREERRGGDYSRDAIILSFPSKGGDYSRETINRGKAIIGGNTVYLYVQFDIYLGMAYGAQVHFLF